jgi:SAM-dependent methyltransferase
MRWLEGTPARYDAGMRALTFGRVSLLHDAVAEAAAPRPGRRVLEVGCGTGSVTERLVARGARVTALDQAPAMLEQARRRLPDSAQVEWLERTASEIDGLPPGAFDAVVLCLCLSDMSPTERAFVLRASIDRLAVGGTLVVADEVRAPPGARRLLQRCWRVPQAGLGWLLTGSVSAPVEALEREVRAAGARVSSEHRWLLGTLSLVIAAAEASGRSAA